MCVCAETTQNPIKYHILCRYNAVQLSIESCVQRGFTARHICTIQTCHFPVTKPSLPSPSSAIMLQHSISHTIRTGRSKIISKSSIWFNYSRRSISNQRISADTIAISVSGFLPLFCWWIFFGFCAQSLICSYSDIDIQFMQSHCNALFWFRRYCLIYVILSTITWLVYHQSMSYTAKAPNQISILYEPYIVILLTSILAYLLTFTKFYRMHTTIVSIVTTIQMCGTSLMLLLFTSPYLFSPLGHFSICIEIILLIYTMIPLRLWQNCALAALYSILFEIASILAKHNDFTWNSLLMRLMMHLCVQLVGFHILVMNVVRMRSTFIEVGQNLLVRRQLEMEKQVKYCLFYYF